MTNTPDFSWFHLIFACAVVIAMMAALAFILKYIGTRGFSLPSTPLKMKRMKIVESLAIDAKRRFVIVSCDGREHLLLLNANRDIVIELNLPPSSSP